MVCQNNKHDSEITEQEESCKYNLLNIGRDSIVTIFLSIFIGLLIIFNFSNSKTMFAFISTFLITIILAMEGLS